MDDYYKLSKKDLGQNFLTDAKIAELMVSLAYIKARGTIVEIGPGHGAVTTKILENLNPDNKLLAVEFDNDLATKLSKKFTNSKNIEIINDDILNWLTKFEIKNTYKMIGSLPYSITSPLLHKIIKLENKPKICVFLVQKEVAQKICANPPRSTYLSSLIQIFYKTKLVEIIEKSKFYPVPKVDGAIVKMKLKTDLPISNQEINEFENFLHKAYSNPRKMLNKAFSSGELQKANLNPNDRPQNISTEKWVELFDKII